MIPWSWLSPDWRSKMAFRYTCMALNSVGASETKIYMRVLSSEPPRIIEAPDDQVAQYGDDVTFV